MKILMLLVWLMGGQPKSEVQLFDSIADCEDYGKARIERIVVQSKNVQGLIAECMPIELQGS